MRSLGQKRRELPEVDAIGTRLEGNGSLGRSKGERAGLDRRTAISRDAAAGEVRFGRFHRKERAGHGQRGVNARQRIAAVLQRLHLEVVADPRLAGRAGDLGRRAHRAVDPVGGRFSRDRGIESSDVRCTRLQGKRQCVGGPQPEESGKRDVQPGNRERGRADRHPIPGGLRAKREAVDRNPLETASRHVGLERRGHDRIAAANGRSRIEVAGNRLAQTEGGEPRRQIDAFRCRRQIKRAIKLYGAAEPEAARGSSERACELEGTSAREDGRSNVAQG